ncbi:MAG: hypothetical protein C0393_03680 [Anaerolinea sp.]|nr:hypothetical protein [Anaerolinea sp.]
MFDGEGAPDMRMERTGLTGVANHDDLATKVSGCCHVPCQSRPAAQPQAVSTPALKEQTKTCNLLYNNAWRYVMNIRGILADIHALEKELLDFERKYGIRSETLYAAYISGEEPENDEWVLDFGEWSSVYRTWLARQADYRNEIQRIQEKASSLTGLVQVSV